jgi:hypothetical protein
MYFVPGAALPFPISDAKRGTGIECANLMKDLDWEGYVEGRRRKVREFLGVGEFENFDNINPNPLEN